MDSSPVNPYLLFKNPNEFRSVDKVLHAFRHPIGQKGIASWGSLSQNVDCHHVICSVNELSSVRGYTNTANRGEKKNNNCAYSKCIFPTKSDIQNFRKFSGLALEDLKDIEKTTWEKPYFSSSFWRWPIEVLFQQYHLLIAIDFSLSAFDVSNSGRVLMDFLPCAIEALLATVKEMLQTREEEAEHIKDWILTHFEEEEFEYMFGQVWKPTIDVSIILINLPKLEMGNLASVFSNSFFEATGGSNVDEVLSRLFPVGALPFHNFECSFFSDNVNNFSFVPLVTRCKAELLLKDENFLSRLGVVLKEYEDACRLRILDGWPRRTLFGSLEDLLRLVPDRSPDCTSLVFITNADAGASHDAFMLLENFIRQKAVILSILFLSETAFRDLQASPLSLFLSSVGGFGVDLQYWFSLASPSLNAHWCRFFAGPRCLSQQLFVQLENKFPVCFASNFPTFLVMNADRVVDCSVLYSSGNVLNDFELNSVAAIQTLLSCIAEARLSQGWSVVMHYNTENVHVAHLCARHQHILRQGKLNILYEMEISYPFVRRRVVASGTKDVLRHFIMAKLDDRTGTLCLFKESKRMWLNYLTIIRSQLHGSMHAEQVALQCFFFDKKLEEPLLLKELQSLSCSEGAFEWWLSHCSVRSIGFFFTWRNSILHFFDPSRKENTNILSIVLLVSRIMKAALKKRHYFLQQESDDVFVFFNKKDKRACYILQLFILDETFANNKLNVIATRVECRFSFFLTSFTEEGKFIRGVVADVEAEVTAYNDTQINNGAILDLALKVNDDDTNARALYLTFCAGSHCPFDAPVNYNGLLFFSSRTVSCAVGCRKTARPPLLVQLQAEKKTRIAKQRNSSCFLIPYLISPWVMSDALAFHWIIGAAETWRTFAEPSFNFFVIRRLRDGFSLLHCVEQHKAILYTSLSCGGHHVVDVFDVIEASAESGNGSFTPQIIIYRYVRPFQFAVSPMYRHNLTADILKDIQISTVLHTFAVLSSASMSAAADTTYVSTTSTTITTTEPVLVLPEELCQRFLRVIPRLDSLLPFLLAKHAHTIRLHSLPSMGKKSDNDLLGAVGRFVSSLGEYSATVDANVLHDSLRQKLFGAFKMERLQDKNENKRQKVLYSFLTPIECSCITLLLMPCVCNDTNSEGIEGVNVYVVFLDISALYGGLMQFYGSPSSNNEETNEEKTSGLKVFSDNLDYCVFNSLFELLKSFCSLYQAWQLLEQRRDSIGREVVVEEEEAQDVLRVFSAFKDYWKEVDISYLLYIQESKLRGLGSMSFLHNELSSLIASMVRSMCLKPLSTHPSAFFPVCEQQNETTEENQVSPSQNNTMTAFSSVSITNQHLKTLPFIMKIALLFVSDVEGNDDSETNKDNCVWITLPNTITDGVAIDCGRLWVPMDVKTQQCASRRLVMRFFLKTAPRHFVDLSSDRYNPPAGVIQRIFRDLLCDYQRENFVEVKPQTSFFAMEPSVEELNTLCRDAAPFDELPSEIYCFFDTIASDLTKSVARYCLTECLHSAPFKSLSSCVRDRETNITEVDLFIESDENENREKGSSLSEEAIYLRCLAQESQEVMDRVSKIFGLKNLLAFAVSPALLSVPCFEADSFFVQFIQHSSFNDSIGSKESFLDIFTRCLADDYVCVVQATTTSFLFVPNRSNFASRWILIYLSSKEGDEAQRVHLLFSEHEEGSDVCWHLCKCIRKFTEAKAREVNQLYLLKKLRDSQNANNELIPSHWGNQFHLMQVGGMTTQSTAESPMKFYCRGTTVLKIPVYYKLQHQCKKILSRITVNCSRLELINIYNREQCFVVADDVQVDIFHYVRLVFVKDTAHLPPVTAPSPFLSPADRCPLLVVQLFSATNNALVQRPLQKLQDFCFFLAIQELQGHLNYVQHGLIPVVDLVFMQYRRLTPVIIDLKDFVNDELLDQTDIQFVFALVVLGLKENKFKSFQVRNEGSSAVSNFAEHYGLVEREGKSCDDFLLSECEQHNASSYDEVSLLRFVKVIEGVTDALVSCRLRVDGESRLVMDRFLTKGLSERYTTGESEVTYIKQICDVLQDAVLQWCFLAVSKCFGVLPSCQVISTVEELMKCAADLTSSSLSTLRFKRFSLDRVNSAVFPFFVECLGGIFKPFSPVCFEVRPGDAPLHISGFPWHWIEHMQQDLFAERVEVYIICGYSITFDAKNGENVVKETRAVCSTGQAFHLSGAALLTQNPLLKERGIELGSSNKPYVLVHISLAKGVRVALFNLRDSDIVLRLIGYLIARTERQSDLLHDIMVQRMGLTFPSYLTESALAEMCCGDHSNVEKGKRLCIYDEAYRRRINHARFPVQQSSEDDSYTIIVEGLFNRGLLINGIFDKTDAIHVLYNEHSHYSWKECKQNVDRLLKEGTFKIIDKKGLCCLTNINCVPDDALICCAFRRHVQTAHVIIESQHSRSGIVEALYDCCSFWHLNSLENDMLLAKSVISLQERSKQIYGSRVPNFTIPRREQWCPSDDVLDQSLPPKDQAGSNYCALVDKALESCVESLRNAFPTARIIDLDANSTAVSSDQILHHRFRCRYGKVFSPDGNVIRFLPHLYYVLIPIAHVVKAMEWSDSGLATTASITKGGFFIVEIGFQVAHFALDVFMVNGESLSASTAAHTAAWFKRGLTFGSVLYDWTAVRLFSCVQMYSTHISDGMLTVDAIEKFVKYYPCPPYQSLNIVTVFDIDSFCKRQRRRMRIIKSYEGPDSSGVRYLIPNGDTILREFTKEEYHYCGLLVLESSRLFVLLSIVDKFVYSGDRCRNDDIQKLAISAKEKLLQLLNNSTLEQELELAWEIIRTPTTEDGCIYDDDDDYGDNEGKGLSIKQLQLLQTRRNKHNFLYLFKPFSQLQVNWVWLLKTCYKALSAVLLPAFKLHIIIEETGKRGVTTNGENADVVFTTLAACDSKCESFTVVEFGGGPRGSIISATLYNNATKQGADDKLLDMEVEIIEQTLRMVSSAIWGLGSF